MVELQKEYSVLQSNVKDLNSRINTLEQNARSANIEIQCVPERKSENLVHIVTQLGAVVGCAVSQEQIVHCSRIAKKDTKKLKTEIGCSSVRQQENSR